MIRVLFSLFNRLLQDDENKENYVAAFGDDIPSSVFLLNLKEKFMCCKHTDRMQSLMKIFM
ncbi:hypothetical protein HanXRQr2_Chr17g0793111 [Helianthus annuus]|uniref:Uncharacterized protein n=1 Tax=Helianthus annuus TaxID=4232 RepID=A0A9K3GT83_HELAN|nr:hypothetical protein HanXRQr2_Chr17g0793111 [Helianthus annuus]